MLGFRPFVVLNSRRYEELITRAKSNLGIKRVPFLV